MKKILSTILLVIIIIFLSVGILYADENEVTKIPVTRESVISEIISNVINMINNEEAEPEEEDFNGELYRITYYCGCKQCCGKWSTEPPIVGAYGRELIDGYSCACPLPNGTEIEIEGYGVVRVDDTTSKKIVEKYNGKIIDIYVTDHKNKPEGIKDYMEIRIKED